MNGVNNDDTSTYPDLDQTDSDNMVAVRSSNITGAANGGAFAAGTEYSVAAILDPTNPTGAITLAYQPTGGSLFTETWSIEADGTNWTGNETSNAYLAVGSTQNGGASSATGATFPDNIAAAFDGTKGDAFMWNEVGTAVPEPSSFALLAGMFGLTWVMLRRRS